MLVVLASLLIVAGADAAPPADNRPSVAVLKLLPKQGVSPDAAELLTTSLVNVLREKGTFSRVVSSVEVEGLLGFEQQKQLLSCDSASCTAELAGALGVTHVVMGSLGRLGDTWLINLTILDTRTATAAGSLTRTVKGDNEGLLVAAIQGAPDELLAKMGAGGTTPQAARPSAMAEAPASPGMAGKILKGAGIAGLGGGALAVLVGAVGALVAGGTWVFLLVMPSFTRGKGLGPLITIGYGGGWGVAGVSAALALILGLAGVAMLVGGVVAG